MKKFFSILIVFAILIPLWVCGIGLKIGIDDAITAVITLLGTTFLLAFSSLVIAVVPDLIENGID